MILLLFIELREEKPNCPGLDEIVGKFQQFNGRHLWNQCMKADALIL